MEEALKEAARQVPALIVFTGLIAGIAKWFVPKVLNAFNENEQKARDMFEKQIEREREFCNAQMGTLTEEFRETRTMIATKTDSWKEGMNNLANAVRSQQEAYQQEQQITRDEMIRALKAQSRKDDPEGE